jgi:voltage-gated potassium channel
MYEEKNHASAKEVTDTLKQSLRRSASLVILLLAIGVAGYSVFFGHTFSDAVYMTVITVGTVGYGEVVPLSTSGKMFTSVLILLSLVVFAYALTTISAFLVSEYTVLQRKRRKMQAQIQKINHHVIVCGYGRNGREAVSTLQRYGKSVVVIESNPSIVKVLEDSGILCLEASAIEDVALEAAGVERASHLITTLPADTDNVFIALSARQLNPSIHICSRASEESNVKKLKVAGVNHVIMPDKTGGSYLATLVVSPDLIEFINNLSSNPSGAMLVQEIILSSHPDVQSLSELRIKERTGCTVIGYKTETGNYQINPDLDIPVTSGGRIIILGNTAQLARLKEVFG